jgi:hypothetical protein
MSARAFEIGMTMIGAVGMVSGLGKAIESREKWRTGILQVLGIKV